MDYILEIALNKYTDFSKFEELATRILNDEGYQTIRAIGGIGDEGADAVQTKYFTDASERTVFQYSLDKKNKQKIIDTIEKLKENNVEYQTLVFVTLNQINNIQVLKTDIRKLYNNSFNIDIIDRRTLIGRLSANNYSLFNTYFPSVRSQIESSVFNKQIYFSDESADILESSLLKCSLLFSFNKDAHSTRKDLLDRLILSIIVSEEQTTISRILEIIQERFSRVFQEPQIRASLQRLAKETFIREKEGQINTTKKATEHIEGNALGVSEATEALVNDIIEKFKKLYVSKIERAEISRIKENIKNSLSAFFRLHGIDYLSNATVANSLSSDFEKNSSLIKITKEGLEEKKGAYLVYAIGDIIKNPTDEQAEILSRWAKAFIGMQIMNLDPNLREFQTTSFKKKTFIIDTDFLLYCLVKECPLSNIYRKLIKELKSLQCKLIIPSNVIAEVIKHGDAENNYYYFRSTFENIDRNIIEEKIHNVFVKGYYYGLIDGQIAMTTSFKSYLSNYIDKTAPYKYLEDLINHYFPNTFMICEMSSLSSKPVDSKVLEKLTNKINDITKGTFKAQWRSEEENHEISYNDANMYLTTYFLNESATRDEHTILPGDFYLLTSSTRAARCALQIGMSTTISAKPETLISLLESLGTFELTSKEYVNIFENPYLVNITNEYWEEMKTLIDAGVDLKDKNPIRLHYDLKQTMHDLLVNSPENVSEKISEEENPDKEFVQLNDFENFVKNIKRKGYNFTPSVEAILEKFKTMEEDLQGKDEIIENLKKNTEIFGKRRQHYLNEISKNPKGANRKRK